MRTVCNPKMATSYGKLDEINTTSDEDWIQYIKKMEYYFLANGILSSDKQWAVLISTMGAKAYTILQEFNYSKCTQ